MAVQYLNGGETPSNGVKRTQVYTATHEGENSLPFVDRAFISFTYGEKKIEDFGLIVVNEGMMQANAYSGFDDLTQEYQVIDGQFYWGTHLKPRTISLILATDGMTQNQFDAFKQWFRPGIERELVLSEHPNRAIKARVSDLPTLSVVPFQEETSVNIGGTNLTVITALYKGTITLSFTADNPNWYSKVNVLGTLTASGITGYNYFTWTNANGQVVDLLTDKDTLKVILEDNVPVAEMVNMNGQKVFFGDNTKVSAEAINTSVSSIVAANQTDPNPPFAQVGVARIGLRTSPSVTTNNFSYSLSTSETAYLYYCGTAKCYPRLKFTITPVFDSNKYISTPRNFMTSSGDKFNTITFSYNGQQYQLKFTTPSLWTEYNRAINIFRSSSEISYVELRNKIRNLTKHQAVRAWAIKVVDDVQSGNTTYNPTSAQLTTIQNSMNTLLSGYSATFDLNFETGIFIGTFTYKKQTSTGIISITAEESVGDMIKFSSLYLEETNRPVNGQITADCCYKVQTNCALTNLFIEYKNMYL